MAIKKKERNMQQANKNIMNRTVWKVKFKKKKKRF